MSANKGRVLWINKDNDFIIQVKPLDTGAFTGLDLLETHWDGSWPWSADEPGYKVIVPTNLMEW